MAHDENRDYPTRGEMEAMMQAVLIIHFERTTRTSSPEHRELAEELAPRMVDLALECGEGHRLRGLEGSTELIRPNPEHCAFIEELFREYRPRIKRGTTPKDRSDAIKRTAGRLWLSIKEAYGTVRPPEWRGNAVTGGRG